MLRASSKLPRLLVTHTSIRLILTPEEIKGSVDIALL